MSRGIFIHGNNNKVSADAENVALINTSDYEVTSEDSGKTIFNGGSVVIDGDGLTGAAIKRRQTTLTGTSNTISFNDGITKFFLDASGGNVAVTVEHSDVDRIFIRKDNTANTAIITPDSGNINGATSYNVATQYEKITVISDGTDLYF